MAHDRVCEWISTKVGPRPLCIWAAIGLMAGLASCTGRLSPTPTTAICPASVPYTPAFEAQAYGEYAKLPASSALRTMIDDYGRERAMLRACAAPK